MSDQPSCSELVGDLDPVGLEVFLTAFEKISSGDGFSLRSFRMVCGLIILYFVWICIISISLMNLQQFLEKVRWSASQWQHLYSVLVHLCFLYPWLLYLGHVANVSQHLFTLCP